MSKITADVLIAGAGPAGSTAAYHLADKGLKVVILDKEKMPRYKTCGGGIVGRARDFIPYSISPVVEKEFKTAKFSLGKGMEDFVVHREKPIISMVMRDNFDFLLLGKAIEKGAVFYENNAVEKIRNNGIIELTTKYFTFEAPFLLAADGAFGKVAEYCGWKESRYLIPALEYEINTTDKDYERLSTEVRFDLNFLPMGYAWCFPKKNHLSVGVLSTRRGKLNLIHYYKQYLEFLGLKNIREEKHGYQIPIRPRSGRLARDNVFLLGDAAGLADPVSAEGISHALLSAKIAAGAILKNPEYACDEYNRQIKKCITDPLKVARILEKFFYQRPGIRKYVFNKNGQKLSEKFTDIFMGDRQYPTHTREVIRAMGKTLF